jgi:hypothetical protein
VGELSAELARADALLDGLGRAGHLLPLRRAPAEAQDASGVGMHEPRGQHPLCSARDADNYLLCSARPDALGSRAWARSPREN